MIHGLYLIATSSAAKTNESILTAAIKGGVRLIQLREKSWPKEKYREEAKRLAALCRKKGALFFVNTYADIAKEVDASGVHLPENFSIKDARQLLPKKIIGKSVHSVDAALKAQKDGADYLIMGPVFPTAGKPGGIGTLVLKQTIAELKIPLIAIGGIKEHNLKDVLACGVAGVAVISAVCTADDVKSAAERLNKIITVFS